MNTNISMHIRQSQTLALTPQMQQSIKLLQMSQLELMTYVQEMVVENPFLEQDAPEDSFSSLSVNDANVGQENTDDSWTHYWYEFGLSKRQFSDSTLSLEERYCRPSTLRQHLLEQLTQRTSHPKMLKVAQYLIDLVEEDGYIREDLSLVAQDLGYSYAYVEEVLSFLQSFDPLGVCARNLSECLKLQLLEGKELSSDHEKVLDHLDELLDISPVDFARKYNVSVDGLKDMFAQLKLLNPKPGYAFESSDLPRYCIPDVIMTKSQGGEWGCDLNEAAFPHVYIDRQSYLTLMNGKQQGAWSISDRNYVNAHISSANALLRSLTQRATTVLRVARAIMEKQTDFLNRGKGALKPLCLKDIALELDIHESTVSRTVTGKYAATPFGVIELKQFLSGSMVASKGPKSTGKSNRQEEVSNGAIQFKIKELIERENKKAPYSDEQIVMNLRQQGISVARRTVTKYREKLNIPSSTSRKKLSQILTFS